MAEDARELFGLQMDQSNDGIFGLNWGVERDEHKGPRTLFVHILLLLLLSQLLDFLRQSFLFHILEYTRSLCTFTSLGSFVCPPPSVRFVADSLRYFMIRFFALVARSTE